MPKEIAFIKDKENPIAFEVMEQAIVDIAAGMKRINQTRLNRKALVILISKDTGVGQTIVDVVLDSLGAIEQTYLKPKNKGV